VADVRIDMTAERFADQLVALLSRAAPDTTTTDVGAALAGVPYPIVPAWPTVAALGASCPLVSVATTRDQLPTGTQGELILVEPQPLLTAGEQPLEKGAVPAALVRFPVRGTFEFTTTALYTDLARQAGAAEPAVRAALEGGVQATVDAEWIDALTTGATAATTLAEAVSAVAAAYGPDLFLLAGIGTTELADSGLPVVVDALVDGVLVVAAAGVSGLVLGPADLAAEAPSVFGTDLASYVMHVPPVVGTGAVAHLSGTP
jgi:hypothetical protein